MQNVSNDLYNYGAAITPSNTVNETTAFDAIHCGVAGTIVVVLADSATVTLVGCLAGHQYRVRGIRVNATGTTADSLVGLRYV